jgi:glycine cleavage system H protein
VESVKAASDIYCPVAAEVVAANEDVVNAPSLINEDPFGKGWIVKIRVKDESSVKSLLSEEEYAKHCEESH